MHITTEEVAEALIERSFEVNRQPGRVFGTRASDGDVIEVIAQNRCLQWSIYIRARAWSLTGWLTTPDALGELLDTHAPLPAAAV